MERKMENLPGKQYCCGCEACSNICPVNAIQMVADQEGFLYPHIDVYACLNCGNCKHTCPILNHKNLQIPRHNIAVWAGYFTEELKLRASASGGAATAISERFIQLGGVVFGVEYCDGFGAARFSSAEKTEELDKFKGSKYIQSSKAELYQKIKEFVESGRRTLFIGLPCEVGAVRSFLRRGYENLYAVELICHGPTSPKVSAAFISYLEKKYRSKVVSFTARYKARGWKEPIIKVVFENGRQYIGSLYQTNYGKAFSCFSRPSCANCIYKGDHRVADMTIGDYWGITEQDPCWNKNGVSIVCVHTEKGSKLIAGLNDYSFFAANLDQAVKGNPYMVRSKRKSDKRELFSRMFIEKGLAYACKSVTPLSARIRAGIKRLTLSILQWDC